MSDIFENVQQCNVIRNSRWFYDSEYSPKLEKVSNSVFENQPSLIETGCEISISNDANVPGYLLSLETSLALSIAAEIEPIIDKASVDLDFSTALKY